MLEVEKIVIKNSVSSMDEHSQRELASLKEENCRLNALLESGRGALLSSSLTLEERVRMLEAERQAILDSSAWKVGAILVRIVQFVVPEKARKGVARVNRIGTKVARKTLSLAGSAVRALRRRIGPHRLNSANSYLPRFLAFVRVNGTTQQRIGWDGNLGTSRVIPLTTTSPYLFSFVPPQGSVESLHLVLAHTSVPVSGRLLVTVKHAQVSVLSASLNATDVESELYTPIVVTPPLLVSGTETIEVLVSPDPVDGCVGIGFRESRPIGEVPPSHFDTSMPVVVPSVVSRFPEEARYVPVYACIDQPPGRIHEERIGWEGIGRERVAVPLGRGVTVGWSIAYPLEKLHAVDLLLGTNGRVNDCRLVLEVRQGEACWLVTKDARDAVNNNYLRFELPDCTVAKGNTVQFVVTCPDATPRHFVSVWGALQPPPTANDSLVRALGPHRELHVNVVQPIDMMARGPQIPKLPLQPLRYNGTGRDKTLIVYDGEPPHAWISSMGVSKPHAVHALSIRYHLDLLDSAETVLLWRVVLSSEIKELLRVSSSLSIPVIGIAAPEVPSEGSTSLAVPIDAKRVRDGEEARHRVLREVGFVASVDAATHHLLEEKGISSKVVVSWAQVLAERQELMSRNEALRLPRISVVSILYRKSREVPQFIQALVNQQYEGEIEIILVDDLSPDDSSERARVAFENATAQRLSQNRQCRIIKNAENIGNCGSRDRALSEARGDIIVIIDADCVVNSTFVARHVRAHRRGDCDVVIGPMNIESGHGDPHAMMALLERSPDDVRARADIQDPTCPNSFLNCVTRNFSISRAYIDSLCQGGKNLFDPAFTYSKNPDSGYGWEDVELGYRLYQQGARIIYEPGAISMHLTHETTHESASMPPRSFKNFRRLLDKHPDLVSVSRRWVRETFEKIEAWHDAVSGAPNSDRDAVNARLASVKRVPCRRLTPRPLRVLTYRWHAPHQYELYKTGHEFFLVTDSGTGFAHRWPYEQRPLPGNAHLVSRAEIDLRSFDCALLHFDENVLDWDRTNGVIGPDWGASFRWLKDEVNLPKIAICHGTPQFVGQYAPNFVGPDVGTVIEQTRSRLVEYLRDVPVICNSHHAALEWGFHRSSVIWQGFDPAEFPRTTYRKGILSLGQSMKERPYYRGYHLYQAVANELSREEQPSGLSVRDPSVQFLDDTNEYAWSKYRNYVDAIRQYSIYFNPTLRSPMPRARGEAMMCGLVTVSANNHDTEMFIKHGWNGFVSNDPRELADSLRHLLRNPQSAKEMGERSRRTAMDLFHHDLYLGAWQRNFQSLVG